MHCNQGNVSHSPSLSLSLVFQVLRREYEKGKKVWQLQIGFQAWRCTLLTMHSWQINPENEFNHNLTGTFYHFNYRSSTSFMNHVVSFHSNHRSPTPFFLAQSCTHSYKNVDSNLLMWYSFGFCFLCSLVCSFSDIGRFSVSSTRCCYLEKHTRHKLLLGHSNAGFDWALTIASANKTQEKVHDNCDMVSYILSCQVLPTSAMDPKGLLGVTKAQCSMNVSLMCVQDNFQFMLENHFALQAVTIEAD